MLTQAQQDYALQRGQFEDRGGVAVCRCVPRGSDLSALLVDVGKRLPGAAMDAQIFNFGRTMGVCAIHPDGSRAAVRYPVGVAPDAEKLARLLAA